MRYEETSMPIEIVTIGIDEILIEEIFQSREKSKTPSRRKFKWVCSAS
jgi:hypothetical protein